MERAAVVLVLVVTTTAQDLVRVVQEVNETTTLSCFYPPQWDSCSFVKDPGHNMQGECTLANNGEETSTQQCREFETSDGGPGWLYVDRRQGRCWLEFVGLSMEHNGTYSCHFPILGEAGGAQPLPAVVEPYEKQFSLTILQMPSYIGVTPDLNESIPEYHNFSLGLPVTTSLDFLNVQPQPRVRWTMDNRDIDGVFVKEMVTRYNDATQDSFMHITELVSFLGKEEFHLAKLQYNITMVMVNEWSNVTREIPVRAGNIHLYCSDCNTTDSLDTTTAHSTSIVPTTSPTSTTTTTTATTSTTTTTTTTTTATKNTTTTTTTTTLESTTTTSLVRNCSYILTDSRGDFEFPVPGVQCAPGSPPSWSLLINCPDMCYHGITLKLSDLSYSGGDPCSPRIRVQPVGGQQETQEFCFNATDPLPPLKYDTKQVNLELLDLSEEAVVSFRATYNFSV